MEHSRTSIINYLIDQNDYKSYLEIGIRNINQNFDLIKCDLKVGIDPYVKHQKIFMMRSDEFFSFNKTKFDIIFIDGDHTKNQTLRDFNNSLSCLNSNGTIVMHDCYPRQEDHQGPVQTTGVWMGEVWKVFLQLRETRMDLSMYVCEADCGCGIIKRGIQALVSLPSVVDWKFYAEKHRELLNLITFDDFIIKEKHDTII